MLLSLRYHLERASAIWVARDKRLYFVQREDLSIEGSAFIATIFTKVFAVRESIAFIFVCLASYLEMRRLCADKPEGVSFINSQSFSHILRNASA